MLRCSILGVKSKLWERRGILNNGSEQKTLYGQDGEQNISRVGLNLFCDSKLCNENGSIISLFSKLQIEFA